MKLITVIILFLSLPTFAQDSLIVTSVGEYNVVYRNVPNLVKVAFVEMDDPYYIECFGGELTNRDTSGNLLPRNNFLVTPGPSRVIYIDVYNISDTSNWIKLGRLEYLNRDLPTPSLFLGATRDGGYSNWNETRMFVKYPPEILLNSWFDIISWKAKIGRKTYSGEGSILSNDFQKQFEKLRPEKEAVIVVKTIGPDGMEREITGTFKRPPNSWYDPIPGID